MVYMTLKGVYLVNINDKIRYIRKQLDLTQEEFAVKVGVSRSFVNKIESGEKRPSIDTLESIAKIGGVTLDYFSEKAQIITDEQIKKADPTFNPGKFVNYAVAIDEAIDAEITPEEIREWIAIIRAHRKK